MPSNLLGKNLRILRKNKNLSMQKLAEKIGSSTGYISDVENGNAVPGGGFIYSLKRALEVDLNAFFTPEGEEAKTDLSNKTSESENYLRQLIKEKAEQIELLKSQCSDLKEDKESLKSIISKQDQQIDDLKREMASLEKGKTSA